MKTKICITVGVIAIIAIGMFVWLNIGDDQEEFVKIGVVLPLTGSYAEPGKNALTGIELAIENHNKAQPARKFQLLVEDSKSNSKDGVSALNKLINIDKIKIVIGDITSPVFLACAPVAQKNKVVMISPGASSPEVSNAGDYIFRIYVSDDFDGKLMAKYIYDVLKKEEIAIVSVNNDYGHGVIEAFINNFERLGGKITFNEKYEKGQNDFRSLILKMKQFTHEVVYIVGGPIENGNLVKQMKELDISSQITGNLAFARNSFIEIARGAFDSIIFSTLYYDPSSEEPHVQNFVLIYKEKYNINPDVAAGLGYDVANILVYVLQKTNYDVSKIKDELYRVKNFPAVTGKTSFDENGDVLKDMVIKQIDGDGTIHTVKIYNVDSI